MSKSLEEFKKNNKPHHKLKKFETKILNLFDDGFSLSEIQKFLKENNVNVSRQGIHAFIIKNIKTVDENPPNKTRVSSVKTSDSEEPEEGSDEYLIQQLQG